MATVGRRVRRQRLRHRSKPIAIGIVVIIKVIVMTTVLVATKTVVAVRLCCCGDEVAAAPPRQHDAVEVANQIVGAAISIVGGAVAVRRPICAAAAVPGEAAANACQLTNSRHMHVCSLLLLLVRMLLVTSHQVVMVCASGWWPPARAARGGGGRENVSVAARGRQSAARTVERSAAVRLKFSNRRVSTPREGS